MAPKETNPAMDLLSRAHSPDTAQQIFTKKVSTRPLHLKPTIPDNAQHKRRLERERKLASRKKGLKPKPLSSRQRRGLGLYDIPPSGQKYSIYAGLNELWLGYLREILGPVTHIGEGEKAKLCGADYHGAEIQVVRSRCVSRVGLEGIVVKDSKFTFEVITKEDVVKTVPKEGTIFKFSVRRDSKPQALEGHPAQRRCAISNLDDKEESISAATATIEDQQQDKEILKAFVFEIHGDQFTIRSADRASKKFKPHYLRDI